MNTFLYFFSMFVIHMCEKIFFLKYLWGTIFCVWFCVYICTNQSVLSTEVTRWYFLNSIVMGQINHCVFQSHVAIDQYCIFQQIKHLWIELSWVEVQIPKYKYQTLRSVKHKYAFDPNSDMNQCLLIVIWTPWSGASKTKLLPPKRR